MKRFNYVGSIVIFLAVALEAPSVFAADQGNGMHAVESAALKSVLASNAMPSSGNTQTDNLTGASNLLWVFGASLVGFSLVMRRATV